MEENSFWGRFHVVIQILLFGHWTAWENMETSWVILYLGCARQLDLTIENELWEITRWLTITISLFEYGIHIWRLKSPASRFFVQSFIQAQMKENIKAPRRWPLWGELRTKGQWRGKCRFPGCCCIQSMSPIVPTHLFGLINVCRQSSRHKIYKLVSRPLIQWALMQWVVDWNSCTRNCMGRCKLSHGCAFIKTD